MPSVVVTMPMGSPSQERAFALAPGNVVRELRTEWIHHAVQEAQRGLVPRQSGLYEHALEDGIAAMNLNHELDEMAE